MATRRMAKAKKARGGATRGRKPDALVITGNWKNAVKGALAKGKPPAKKSAAKKKRPKSS